MREPARYHPTIGAGRVPFTSHVAAKLWPSRNGPKDDEFFIGLNDSSTIWINDGGTINKTKNIYNYIII